MAKTIELKPCPFCYGRQPKGGECPPRLDKFAGAYQAICPNFYCNINPYTKRGKKAKAIEFWNTRAGPEPGGSEA